MKKQVTFMLEEDDLREFERHAKSIGATKSGVLRVLLSRWVEGQGDEGRAVSSEDSPRSNLHR